MFVRRNARPLAALSVSLVLAAGALAGCSDGQAEPPEPEPSSASSSPSASPTEPVEPTLPAEALGDDAAAAEAFVRHYYNYVNYAQATGDTKGLRELGLRSCAACNSSVAWVERVYRSGGVIQGGDYRVRRTTVEQVKTNAGAPLLFGVVAHLTNSEQVIKGAGAKLNDTYPAGPSRWRLLLVRDSESWRISRWEVL